MIVLETERLAIRDHRIEDLRSHHILMSDNTVMKYLQDIKTNSFEESKENLRITIEENDYTKRSMVFLKIIDKKSNEHIGEIGYTVTKVTREGKVVHLGYFSYEIFWGKGYITEALKAIIRFAFENDSVAEIVSGCHVENIGSVKVMEKSGLKKVKDYKELEFLNGEEKERVKYILKRSQWIPS